MNIDRIAWLCEQLRPEQARGARVLEIGSYRSGIRRILESWGVREYVGVDVAPGPGVDRIADISQGAIPGDYNVVICEEVLEHVLHWEWGLRNLFASLREGGRFLVTVPSLGVPYHEAPRDYWRFGAEVLRRAIDAAYSGLGDECAFSSSTLVPGIYVTGLRPPGEPERIPEVPCWSILLRRMAAPSEIEGRYPAARARLSAAARRSLGSWVDVVRRRDA